MAKKTRKRGIAMIDGSDPSGTILKITKAGDGLSKALSIDDRDFVKGVPVYAVLELTPTNIAMASSKDSDDEWLLQFIMQAGRATFVDEDLVADLLDKQDRRIEEADGIHRLFDENGEPIEDDEVGDQAEAE